jgi:branched-chain amino acid transport system permease protein
MKDWRRLPWIWIALGSFALWPLLPGDPGQLGGKLRDIFIFAILAQGLNVVVGYSGLLQLGIAAFFGIGAYIMGILTVQQFPFQVGVWPAMVCATIGAGIAGLILAAPTLRLRGDYLAIVTLGFGEVIKFAIKNLENITNGSRALNPLPSPWVPGVTDVMWNKNYRFYYYLALGVLALVVLLLKNLENSRLGRAWMAIREDELAATCMGTNATGVKLSAFAMGAALAGLAGSLYAVSLDQTGGPDSYTFNRSITVLVFLIIGGMGNIPGARLGTFVLMGYDNIATPEIDKWMQSEVSRGRVVSFMLVYFPVLFTAAVLTRKRWLAELTSRGLPRWGAILAVGMGTAMIAYVLSHLLPVRPLAQALSNFRFTDVKLVIFGLALIVMMRFRPEGILPSKRVAMEMHEEKTDPEVNRVGVE